jgi:serine/threonine-protein kinase RsbW
MMSHAPSVWSTDVRIPSQYAAGKAVLHDLLKQLENAHWSEQEVHGVHLAVEEALTNAIRHGNRLDLTKHVHVICKLSADRLWIEIRDEGPGFNPGELPDPTADENLETPCGRGVFLMRCFMSRVEYHDCGNRVVMEKHRNGETK